MLYFIKIYSERDINEPYLMKHNIYLSKNEY